MWKWRNNVRLFVYRAAGKMSRYLAFFSWENCNPGRDLKAQCEAFKANWKIQPYVLGLSCWSVLVRSIFCRPDWLLKKPKLSRDSLIQTGQKSPKTEHEHKGSNYWTDRWQFRWSLAFPPVLFFLFWAVISLQSKARPRLWPRRQHIKQTLSGSEWVAGIWPRLPPSAPLEN